MGKYYVKVPGNANSFTYGGTAYKAGDRFETDDPCSTIRFYNAIRSANPEVGKTDETPDFWKNVNAACLASGGGVVSDQPVAGITNPPNEAKPPTEGDSAATQGAKTVDSKAAGVDTEATPPGSGTDAPDAEEATSPPDGEPHPTRAGEETRQPTSGGEPVDLFSGTVFIDETDLEIPDTILPLALVRSYRSGGGFYCPFGWNWDHNHNLYLRELANGDIALWRLTREERFVFTGSGFEPPRSVFERLERSTAGADVYELTAAGGMVTHFGRPPGWTDATRIPVLRVSDRHGNMLRYSYDTSNNLVKIEDDDGHFIALSYDDCGLIVVAVDHAGRRYSYEHDEENRHLVRVTRPATADYPDGAVRQYRYPVGATPPSRRHNLLGIEDAEGNVYVEYSYEEDPASANYGRVASQLYGDYLYQFCYEQLQYVPPAEGNVNVLAARTVVLNPDCTLETYTFNFRGDLIDRRYRLNKDGSYRIAAWQYDFDGQANRTRIVKPDGSEERYVFDAANADPCMRGTLLRKELTAAAGFPSPSRIVWRGEYEPRFQLLVRAIDEAGATTQMRYDFDLSPAAPDNSGKLMKILHPDATLPDGSVQHAVTRFAYNARGQTIAEFLPDGTRNEMHYGATGAERGRLVEKTEDAGNLAITSHYSHDPNGFLFETTDGAGAVTQQYTNALGALERLVRPAVAGATDEERYHYDPDGHVVRVERPKGAYQGVLTDPGGTHFIDLFERDVMGYATSVTICSNCEERRTVEFCNDYRGLAERTRMPGGAIIYASFDEHRQPVDERVVGADGLQLHSRNGYDRAGKLVRQVDVFNRMTRFAYDGFGRVQTVTLPNGAERRLVWGQRDQLLSEELVGDDGTGTVRRLSFTAYAYDEKGRRVSTTMQLFEEDPAVAGVHTTRFVHDARDRVVQIIDHRGGVTSRQYDGLGRLVQQSDPMGNSVRYTYDAAGNIVKRQHDNVAPGGGITTSLQRFSYDARGRCTGIIEPDGASTTMLYDDRDVVVQTRNQLGVVTSLEYDAFSRRLREVQDVGGLAITQRWQHDSLSRVTDYVDPTGETTRYGYDSVGRLATLTYPGGFTTTRHYDAESRMAREVLASGTTLNATYDTAGRLTGLTCTTAASGLHPVAAHQFTYDGLDRVTRAEAGGEVIERHFDSRGRLLLETAQGNTIRCHYDDAAGTVEKHWPDGRTEVLAHDLNGRMTSVVQTSAGALGAGNGSLASFELDGPDMLGKASFRGGSMLRTRFDARRRLTEMTLTSPVGPSEHVWYRYDSGNQCRVEALGGTLPVTSYFEFDARQRLHLVKSGFTAPLPVAQTQAEHDAAIAAVRTAAVAAAKLESFGYDAADARRIRHETGSPATPLSYTPGHRLASDGTHSYSFSPDGVLQSGGNVSYEADALGRIVAVRSGGVLQLELSYDAFGRVRSLHPAGDAPRSFQYLGSFVAQESVGGVPERQITIVPGTGVPLAYHTGAGTHFALVDARFNLLGLLDTNGALTEVFRYRPFGMPQIFAATGAPRATSAFGVRPLFGGQNYLGEPALYLSRLRLMSPALGLYLSPDPGGYADSPMLYGYAGQNPIDNIDPDGDFIFILAALVIGGALAGAAYSYHEAKKHPDEYAGLRGSLRILGNVFGGAAIGGLAFAGGEIVLAAGGTGAFASGAAGATSLTATQAFVLYGTSSVVSGATLRGGFHSLFPEDVSPVTPGTMAFDFVTGGGIGAAIGRFVPAAPGFAGEAPLSPRSWFNMAGDKGGLTQITGKLGPYPGRVGKWLERFGIRQGYRTNIVNNDLGGSWFARTDTAAHEGFHAFMRRYFPTAVNLSHQAHIWGAAARYPEEVAAYAIGHTAALRFHYIPYSLLEAFGSLTRYPQVQQKVAKVFWGTALSLAGAWTLDKLFGSDEPTHPNDKPPGAK